VGWGGVITFICAASHIWCYAAVRLFALPHIYGKTVPTTTSPSSLQKLWRTLSAEKKIVPLRCFTYPVKSTRVLFKEIELWERCKTTVIFGMKSMTNTANVENAGSINNPPGWLYMVIPCYSLKKGLTYSGFLPLWRNYVKIIRYPVLLVLNSFILCLEHPT